MTLKLAIVCGVAETVGAILDDDDIVRFFFAPARGDEAGRRAAEAGDIVLGRIKTAAPALDGAFVDIGDGVDAFLPSRRDEKPPAEGALLTLGVWRPALGGKGAVLSATWKAGLSPQQVDELSAARGAPRLLSHSFDSALVIARRAAAFGVSAIVIDGAEGGRALAAHGVESACDERSVRELDIEDALGRALAPAVPLGGGARMVIAETAGGAVIDIDSGSASNASRKPNDAVNALAARRLLGELSRRAIGGRVIVDFLPPSSPSQRRSLLETLGVAPKYYACRPGKLAPDGLFDLTAPRRDLSLLERASEETGEGLLRAGRRFTLDWTAKRAIAALEARLERHPRLKLSLDAAPEIASYIAERPHWLARLADRYGQRVTVAVIATSPGCFDVREL